jgi:hypothetical protein
MSLRHRLERLEGAAEYQRIVALADAAGRPHGLSAAQMVAGMRAFLAMPETEQRAFLPAFYASLSPEDEAELPALLAHHWRVLRGGKA